MYLRDSDVAHDLAPGFAAVARDREEVSVPSGAGNLTALNLLQVKCIYVQQLNHIFYLCDCAEEYVVPSSVDPEAF